MRIDCSRKVTLKKLYNLYNDKAKGERTLGTTKIFGIYLGDHLSGWVWRQIHDVGMAQNWNGDGMR